MILPGVTRDSVLSLAKGHSAGTHRIPGLPENLVVEERPVTMKELKEQIALGNVAELFGTGAYPTQPPPPTRDTDEHVQVPQLLYLR